MVSPQKRIDILNALRRGTVPQAGLDALAVGIERFSATVADELAQVARGGAMFKAIRGDYGCGKTFFVRWLQEQALAQGFVTAEIQISESETPLHRLETVYRRLIERLRSSECDQGAFRSIIDAWFFALEEDVLSGVSGKTTSPAELLTQTTELLEKRLAPVSRVAPAFALALRGYRAAVAENNSTLADGLLAWIAGQPNVAADVKRNAGIKGEVDHFAALGFLQGLLNVLRDSGRPGLVVVLDEVETLQRVRGDVREKALNALRQLIDEIDAGRFPGLYLIITGTPAFFDGAQGVQRLPPLAQRLHVDFATDPRFDNPRAAQIRLRGFDSASLKEVGGKVRSIFIEGSAAKERVLARADDKTLERLADGLTGQLGGKVGVAPRLFLKKLVSDVLDRIDQYPNFYPEKDYALTLMPSEMTSVERAAAGFSSVDDIPLNV
ncbi:MAG: BREX system ATP-binding protein BrxD [Verrucomicrobia bacterium]|nr:BREX system ATP-binding protein BrxD [Verrucomicrobiota bacterium]